MKSPEFRQLAKEEFPEAAWIGKLLDPLNKFLSGVRSGLSNGLTLGDNFNAEIRTLDFTTRAAWIDVGALLGSWVAYASNTSPGYSVVGYDVVLRGRVKGGSIGGPVLYLPAGYRPERLMLFPVRGNGIFASVQVNPADGSVTPIDGTSDDVSLDSVRFPVAGSPPASSTFPLKFKSKVKGKIGGMVVLRCIELDGKNEKPINSAVSVDWAQDGENAIIKNVAGLTGGKTYRLTVAAFGG